MNTNKVTLSIALFLVVSVSVIFYGVAKAHQVCGSGGNSMIMTQTYLSLNPVSAEVFRLQCLELNRGY